MTNLTTQSELKDIVQEIADQITDTTTVAQAHELFRSKLHVMFSNYQINDYTVFVDPNKTNIDVAVRIEITEPFIYFPIVLNSPLKEDTND